MLVRHDIEMLSTFTFYFQSKLALHFRHKSPQYAIFSHHNYTVLILCFSHSQNPMQSLNLSCSHEVWVLR